MVRLKKTKENEITLHFETNKEWGEFQLLSNLFDLKSGTISSVSTLENPPTEVIGSMIITLENSPKSRSMHELLKLLLYSTTLEIQIDPTAFYEPKDVTDTVNIHVGFPAAESKSSPSHSQEEETEAPVVKTQQPSPIETLITTYVKTHSKELKFEENSTFNKQALQLYQAEILHPLEQEKKRLIERRRKTFEERKELGTNVNIAHTDRVTLNNELKKQEQSYIKRIVAFSEAIANINMGIMNPKPNYHWVDDVHNPIQALLKNPDLAIYKDQKWLRRVANAVAFLFTGILPGIIKYAATGSLFFSMEGDSRNAALKVLSNNEKITDARQKGGEKMQSYYAERIAAHQKRLGADTKNAAKKKGR